MHRTVRPTSGSMSVSPLPYCSTNHKQHKKSECIRGLVLLHVVAIVCRLYYWSSVGHVVRTGVVDCSIAMLVAMLRHHWLSPCFCCLRNSMDRHVALMLLVQPTSGPDCCKL